ncbi:hypothetical protein C8R43DRAFT_993529 [Mycena crocata]|nr:hypothetical protein C8R43DRAFT_993529 [Mycena crocata]
MCCVSFLLCCIILHCSCAIQSNFSSSPLLLPRVRLPSHLARTSSFTSLPIFAFLSLCLHFPVRCLTALGSVGTMTPRCPTSLDPNPEPLIGRCMDPIRSMDR